MKPLCEKIYINKIVEIVTALICAALDIIFIVNKDDDFFWWMVIIPFTALVVWMVIDSIYWIFQPKILIYQYDTGIVINRNEKIEYTDIEKIYYKNYIRKMPMPKGNYYRDTYGGIIFIILKSGKKYKIRNAFYPIGVVDTLLKMKKQKKFR